MWAMHRTQICIFAAALLEVITQVPSAGALPITQIDDRKTSDLDERIAAFVDELRALDVNSARHGDISIELQGQTNKSQQADMAPRRLFSYVDENFLFSRPTYASFVALTKFYGPDVNLEEQSSPERMEAEHNFLDEVFETAVMRKTWQFIAGEGKTSNASIDEFRKQIAEVWFGLYSRGTSKRKGSSGFEHVFVGEWKKGEVSGLHNWVRYYLLEKAGQIDYRGYLLVDGQLALNIKFNWDKYSKPIGGFLVGTSPEFDLGLLSMCFFVRRGQDACKFRLGGYKMAATTYTLEQDGHTYVGTAYPSPL